METKKINVNTNSSVEMLPVSRYVKQALSESGVKEGLCVVYVPHTTAGVTINEGADPSVQSDMIKELGKIVPLRDNYAHAEGNSAAHIKTSLFGPSISIPVMDGALALGTWQEVYFCEFDGPRTRRLYIKIIKD